MLPVYKAETFKKMLSGGTTRPWLVLVSIEGRPTPYVVKLYNKIDLQQSHCVAKDVFCSILATEFGLDTPSPALIQFPDSFIEQLPEDKKVELKRRDDRIKFGCVLIEGDFMHIDTLGRDSVKKYPVESIYAFDNLTINADRHIQKPNILFQGINAFLIDHEKTFTVNEYRIESFNNNVWNYNKEVHIFYKHLKNGKKEDKVQYFQEFQEKLEVINFDVLDKYFEQLAPHGHINEEVYYTIKEYLCHLQKNANKFVNLLRIGLLQ
jgi:hypothetical protein